MVALDSLVNKHLLSCVECIFNSQWKNSGPHLGVNLPVPRCTLSLYTCHRREVVARNKGSSAKIAEGQVWQGVYLDSRKHFPVNVQPMSQAFTRVIGGRKTPVAKPIEAEYCPSRWVETKTKCILMEWDSRTEQKGQGQRKHKELIQCNGKMSQELSWDQSPASGFLLVP